MREDGDVIRKAEQRKVKSLRVDPDRSRRYLRRTKLARRTGPGYPLYGGVSMAEAIRAARDFQEMMNRVAATMRSTG